MARALAILTLAVVPLMVQAPVRAAPVQRPSSTQAKAPWRDVTPREGLAGWRTTGGKATYAFENGEVIGRAEPGKTNSWLVSDAQYGDFIVEFDAKTDPALNSGMMIRGQSRPDYRDGVVYGYQAESIRRRAGGAPGCTTSSGGNGSIRWAVTKRRARPSVRATGTITGSRRSATACGRGSMACRQRMSSTMSMPVDSSPSRCMRFPMRRPHGILKCGSATSG